MYYGDQSSSSRGGQFSSNSVGLEKIEQILGGKLEQLLIYFAIGGCTGWLLGWAMGRGVPRVIKYIIFGGIGGLAGGFLIDMIKDLAPMAGSALGALVLLAFLRKK
ncbi:MAG: hypothetical protein CMO45_09470 [Verrucomicrobiales bacterium]|nr:hypothetical protein [Verrucomicrobiales bacterium]